MKKESIDFVISALSFLEFVSIDKGKIEAIKNDFKSLHLEGISNPQNGEETKTELFIGSIISEINNVLGKKISADQKKTLLRLFHDKNKLKAKFGKTDSYYTILGKIVEQLSQSNIKYSDIIGLNEIYQELNDLPSSNKELIFENKPKKRVTNLDEINLPKDESEHNKKRSSFDVLNSVAHPDSE